MYRKILIPIDGSKGATMAAEQAIELARVIGARVSVLHVIDKRSYLGLGEAGRRELRKRLTDKGEKYVKDVTAKASGMRAEKIVLEGHPAEVVVKVADDKRVDLIVMGTRGLTGARRMLLGSTAEQVIRWAPCPVLVVRQK